MIRKFYYAHPEVVNIITTNYDSVMEYALSHYGFKYSDGFSGRCLSKFSVGNFIDKETVNILKVHGSINWYSNENEEFFFLPNAMENTSPAIVLPSSNKFRETAKSPYRDLITKSDEMIDAAKSFLVVGFGFNDEHLTPKIDRKIKQGTPMVVLTKEATEECNKKIKNSQNCALLQEKGDGTEIKIRLNGKDEDTINIERDYWTLNTFMEKTL